MAVLTKFEVLVELYYYNKQSSFWDTDIEVVAIFYIKSDKEISFVVPSFLFEFSPLT